MLLAQHTSISLRLLHSNTSSEVFYNKTTMLLPLARQREHGCISKICSFISQCRLNGDPTICLWSQSMVLGIREVRQTSTDCISVDAHREFPDTSVVSMSNLSAWNREITVQAAKLLKSNAELLLWACENIIRSTGYKRALSYTLIPLKLVVCACLNSHNKFSSVDAQ